MILLHCGLKVKGQMPPALQHGLLFHIIFIMDNMNKMDNTELHTMIADYMDKGFLENIEDMLRDDPSLFSVLPLMISDERMGVRIGVVALAESMRESHLEDLRKQIPGVAALLTSENPTIRGDVVYLLSAIAHPDALPYLEAHKDEHPGVIQMIGDTIAELKTGNG